MRVDYCRFCCLCFLQLITLTRNKQFKTYLCAVIVVENLCKSYGTHKALDSISFSASAGRVAGFLGPNGAGKSTTMKILSGFLAPDGGRVEIAGVNIVEQALEAKRLLGYLPENNPLYLDLYVKESLAVLADIHQLKNKKSRIAEVIEMTGLGPQQHQKVGALSKGFRQRLGLAQAILHDPKVLILDEPTSGLDPNQVLDIRNLIKELGKTKTVLLSTHILQEVEVICEQVMILSRGKLIADHPKQTLLDLHPGKSLEQIFAQLTCNY